MTNTASAKFTLWVNRILFLALCGMVLAFPALMGWYGTLRSLSPACCRAITVGFYLCVPVTGFALWCIERLLGNILSGAVFVETNIRCLRRLRWCCAGVSGICLGVGIWYQPLLLVMAIMAFLALIVSVVKSVLAAAVALREENDLTV